jgi:hypothetical protein
MLGHGLNIINVTRGKIINMKRNICTNIIYVKEKNFMFNHDGAIAYESDFQVLFNHHVNINFSKQQLNQAVLYMWYSQRRKIITDGLCGPGSMIKIRNIYVSIIIFANQGRISYYKIR